MIKRVRIFIEQAIQFVTYDIWHIQRRSVRERDFKLIRLAKIILISVRGFLEDKVNLQASALTYYSLIALVPVLSVSIAIAKGFGLQEHLVEMLTSKFSDQQALLDRLLRFADSMLAKISGGVVTGISVFFLLWAVLKLLANIEHIFNGIWQIKRNRPWSRKIADYLAVMLFAPVFMILASSISIMLNTQVMVLYDMDYLSYLAPVVVQLLNLSSYMLIWVVFAFVYIALPYTRVKVMPAIVAGIVAGTAFQLVQHFYIYSQITVSRYSAIYGSFAAIPLFLIWIQISWLILLFGAELAFAIQNVERYEYEINTKRISLRYKRLVTLLIMKLIVRQFLSGNDPLTTTEIATKLGVPIRLSRDIIFELHECNLIRETITKEEKENAYVPGIDVHEITVGMVLTRIEERGSTNYRINKDVNYKHIENMLQDISQHIDNNEGQKRIMDL